MALPKFYKVVQDQQGNIVPQVLGSVFNQGTGVLAALYQDDAGTVPLSNPMTSDAQYGSFKFYLNPGHYDLTFTKPGYTFEPIYDFQVVEDVLTLGSMATQNATAVAITGGLIGGTTALNTIGPVAVDRLGVGTAAPAGSGTVHIQNQVGVQLPPQGNVGLLLGQSKSAQVGIMIKALENDASGQPAISFNNVAGTGVGSIVTSATATAYNTSSDGRLKEAVTALPQALETIQRLRPVAFRWTRDGSSGQGLIAQEVLPVVPQAVTGDPADPVPAMQLDFSKLVPHLIGAVQALAQQVQALTARLAALETP